MRTPWQIDFLNVGLFFGQHKVLGKSDDQDQEVFYSERESLQLAAAHYGADPAAGYCANVNRLLAGTLPGKQASILGRFLALNSAEVARECLVSVDFSDRTRLRTRNMFLPISLGGMGINPPVSWRWRVSENDRKFASTLASGSSLRPSFGRPLPGFEPSAMDEVTSPWVEKREWLPLGVDQCRAWGIVKSVSKKLIKVPYYGWCDSPSAVAR
jgi:hypothetical protein